MTSPTSLTLLHGADTVGRPINQVSLSFIKLEASDGGFYIPSTNLLGKHTAFFQTISFSFKTQRVSLYLVLLTQRIKFPVSLMYPPPIPPTKLN